MRLVGRNAGTATPCEAYDFSRDLAIEGFVRFTARIAEPGPHAETYDVIVGVNPTERDLAVPVLVEHDSARETRTVTTVAPFRTVTADRYDQPFEGGESVAPSGHGRADAASRRAQS